MWPIVTYFKISFLGEYLCAGGKGDLLARKPVRTSSEHLHIPLSPDSHKVGCSVPVSNKTEDSGTWVTSCLRVFTGCRLQGPLNYSPWGTHSIRVTR